MRGGAFAAVVALLALGACGGRAGSSLGTNVTDAGADGGTSASDATVPATPIPLLPIAKNELLGLLAFDAKNVYAAIFTASPNDPSCNWRSRWVRVAKDGSSVQELGAASTCDLFIDAHAVVVDAAIYWLARDGSTSSTPTSVLMTIPTAGGSATRVATFARAFDNIGTDGHSFFVTSVGTPDQSYADGFVARIDKAGTMATLVDKQLIARWVGVTATDFVWSTYDDCDMFGATNCKSTTFHRIPTGGGTTAAIGKWPAVNTYPTTLSNDGVYFYDRASTIVRLSFDGSQGSFLTVPWGNSANVDAIRVVADEVIASGDVSTDIYLMAEPRRYDSAFADSAVFDIDDGFVYAQQMSALMKLPVP